MTEALEMRPGIGDGDLVRAAAEGDRQAFAEIYDRYADRLYDFCVGLLGDRDAAADCVQDAFCVAATDLGNLREPDKLRPWLYSITRHHAMRRLRHRYREEVSDELPDMVSQEASPETLVGQSELARLVAEAAGGLSDRDRELLDLSYRHGLDGPELAEALGVTLTSANTMMFRLRQTVERCLGALLVARGARANPHVCPELAAILKGWDGQFTVLMRKRMARHIDSCDNCEQDQRRQVNPVALLGGAPVFIPAPDWLRRQTLERVQLTCASSGLPEASGPSAGSRLSGKRLALAVGVPLLCLGLSVPWFAHREDPVSGLVDTGADSGKGPLSVAPAAVKGAATPAPRQAVPSAGAAGPALPGPQAEATPGASTPGPATETTTGAAAPGPTPGPVAPAPAPGTITPAPDPDSGSASPDGDPAAIPNSAPEATAPEDPSEPAPAPDPKVSTTDPKGGTPPVTNPKVTDTGPPVNTATIPNPNLNPKFASPYPQTNTGTITNPNATSPNLQINTGTINSGPLNTGSINTVPKPNTNLNTAPNLNTNTNTNTNTGSGNKTSTR